MTWASWRAWEIVGQLDPKKTTVSESELGLYMSGAKRDNKGGDEA